MSGLELVEVGTVSDSVGWKQSVAYCPEGKRVVGGGSYVDHLDVPTLQVALTVTGPLSEGWVATAEEMTPTSVNWRVAALALCANVVE